MRFRGDGVVVVRCILRISLARPYFHSMSDCAWIRCAVVFNVNQLSVVDDHIRCCCN
ncbi:hypothetical protein L798_03198 [Zootermopsis nevadensis]|uniref:Uncharacterized protein n=1 Tax=Zootermopsis nevadensis TaxID=136037 RepID=A0A067RDA4_ZOONE|nr:hypothetical protein L798_03198 [Zootermopsis nevadensis]